MTAGFEAAMFALVMTASRSRRKLLYAGTIAALVILVGVGAIAIPNYLATDAANKARACQHEFQTVQAGLRSYMAYFNVSTVTAGGPTNNMSSPVKLWPIFVANSSTTFAYAWESTGRIDLIAAVSDGPPIPVGCTVSD
ncbi:MAG TPA: hypothetical protein VG815_02525 [Chloroflexota bacterium]|nr:hypothetical protein [Chloroflexota bacterium]